MVSNLGGSPVSTVPCASDGAVTAGARKVKQETQERPAAADGREVRSPSVSIPRTPPVHTDDEDKHAVYATDLNLGLARWNFLYVNEKAGQPSSKMRLSTEADMPWPQLKIDDPDEYAERKRKWWQFRNSTLASIGNPCDITSCLTDVSLEEKLNKWTNYICNRWDPEVIGGGDYHSVHCLPPVLEQYVLNRDFYMRRLYQEAEQKYGHLMVRMFSFREWDYHGTSKNLCWMGLLVNPDDTPRNLGSNLGKTSNEKNEVSPGDLFIPRVAAWHGTILSNAEKLTATPGVTLTRGTRYEKAKNVKPDECYAGDWRTALTYTASQWLLPPDFDEEGNTMIELSKPNQGHVQVITVLGLTAPDGNIRKDPTIHNETAESSRIVLIQNARPLLVLMRPDDGTQTLRNYVCDEKGKRGDRYMCNHQKLVEELKVEREYEAARKARNSKSVALRSELTVWPRNKDLELEKNSADMSKFKDQES